MDELRWREPRDFHIPCAVDGLMVTTLYDTGAAINVIPSQLVDRLKLKELQP